MPGNSPAGLLPGSPAAGLSASRANGPARPRHPVAAPRLVPGDQPGGVPGRLAAGQRVRTGLTAEAALAQHGLFRTEYTGATLREHYGVPRPDSQFTVAREQAARPPGVPEPVA
jgi:hypothetical protein